MTTARRQDGIALPVAVIVLTLTLLLTAALMLSVTRGSAGADRDRLVKRALQSADAGVDVARSQLKAVGDLGALAATDCISTNATTGAAFKGGTAVSGWCPTVTGQLADGATYSYQLSTTTPRKVISTGSAPSGRETETRRVVLQLGQSADPIPYFGVYGISSKDAVDLAGGTTLLDDASGKTQLRSNSTIKISGGAKLGCGNFTPGPGQKVIVDWDAKWCMDSNGQATSSSVQMPTLRDSPPSAFNPAPTAFTLPAIPAADLTAAKNGTSASRITNCKTTTPDDGTSDYCPNRGTNGEYSWNATSRKLTLGGVQDWTLRGSVYYFCSLKLGGSAKLRIPAGNSVKIYIDKCSGDGASDAGTFTRDGGSIIDNQSNLPERVQIFVNGGGKVDFPSDNVQRLTIYAPDSIVNMSGAAKLIGAVAGKQVTVSGSGGVISTSGTAQLGAPSSDPDLPPVYKECVSARTSAVSSGCD